MMLPADHAYLSIIEWPAGMDRQAKVQSLAEATGMDPFLADQRVAKGVPAVVHRMDGAVAGAVLGRLYRRGVTAFAPAESQIRAIPAPVRAKRLAGALGAPAPMYHCEMWRAPARGLLAGDIFLIVRARIRVTRRGPAKVEPSFVRTPYTGTNIETTVTHDERTRFNDTLDLYLRDGSRIRIDGNKFNWDVLGDERGYSDGENGDRLALRLAGDSPSTLVDTGFGSFICPRDLIRGWMHTDSDGGTTRDDNPAFEFYSVWSFLKYRLLVARRKIGG